jgi:hypothetical protein
MSESLLPNLSVELLSCLFISSTPVSLKCRQHLPNTTRYYQNGRCGLSDMDPRSAIEYCLVSNLQHCLRRWIQDDPGWSRGQPQYIQTTQKMRLTIWADFRTWNIPWCIVKFSIAKTTNGSDVGTIFGQTKSNQCHVVDYRCTIPLHPMIIPFYQLDSH